MTYYNRVSDVELSVLDFGDFNDGMAWGGIIHDGVVYVLCSEGVGYNLSEKTEAAIQQGWGTTLGQVAGEITLVEKGQTNLKDLIRQFGDRLEQNFNLWNAKLS